MNSKRLALVTGATRGIGLAITKKLLRSGISVIGTSREKASLRQTVEELNTDIASLHPMELDITKSESVQGFLERLSNQELVPNILVNNAAIVRDNLLIKMKDNEWNDVITGNLNTVFFLTRNLVRPMLKARYGRIINISSVVCLSGNAGQCNYVAAKAGLVGFTKSIALEVAKRGVTANVIAPGFIDTDMTRSLSESQKSAIISQIPAKKIGKADDIAATVAFLISEEANYITGETINVNGGLLMN